MESYWHYHVWKRFNEEVYKKTLTSLDLKGKRFYLDEFTIVDEDNTVTKQGVYKKVYRFDKGGDIYLLPEDYINKLPCNPTEYVEGYYKEGDKTIHRLVTDVDSAKIGPEKFVSVKTFVDAVWNPVKHTDPQTKAFLSMLTIASSWKPTKVCICSEPGSGKSSGFTIAKYITNDVVKIENPSKAKLQTLFCFYNQVIIEEITNVTKAQWKEVESMILLVSDDSPDLEKHSLAQNSNMNNMNVSNLSLVFPYNRVEDVKKVNSRNRFFEEVLNNPNAFRRRFLQLLIPGKVLDKPPKPGEKEATDTLMKNFEVMKKVARQFIYLSTDLDKELHGWKANVPVVYRDVQQKTNFEGFMDVLDAYCETQEEFDGWCLWLNQKVNAYNGMVSVLGDGSSNLLEDEE